LLPPPGKKQSQAISWRAFFDVENGTFFLKGRNKSVAKRIEKNDPALVALSDLVLADDPTGIKRTSNIEKAILRLVEGGCIKDSAAAKNEARNKLQRVATMLDTDVLFHEIETSHLASSDAGEIEVAIDIFRRLNSGGMRLSAGDVAAAQLAQETTASILGPMRDFARGKLCVALGLNFVFLTRALAIIRCGMARFSKLPKNWATGAPAIDDSWELTRKSLDTAIAIALGAGWTDRRWLPSTNALLPVAFFASLKGGCIPEQDREEAVRFLCLAAWAGAFSRSSETAIDHYVRHVQKVGSRSAAKVLTQAIPKAWYSKITPEDVIDESKTGTLMQIYLAYLISRSAKSWPSGQLLAEACKVTDGVGDLEVHHIFPRQFVEKVEAEFDVNTMANYAILSKGDNVTLGDEDPKAAYGALTIAQKKFAAEQFIPFGDADALLVEAYEAFIKYRAKAMAAALNKFIGL